MTTTEMAAGVRAVWPLLFVKDLQESVQLFRDRLGFTVVGQAEHEGMAYWCRLSRGGASIMLQQAEAEDGTAEGRGRGVSLFFVCADVDDLYREFSRRGLPLDEPAVAHYGMKQLFIREPTATTSASRARRAHKTRAAPSSDSRASIRRRTWRGPRSRPSPSRRALCSRRW